MRRVAASASVFAVLILVATPVFGWQLDGWLVLLGALVHLLVVAAASPRFGSRFVAIHYGILAVTVVAIALVLRGLLGADGSPFSLLGDSLRAEWSSAAGYLSRAIYLALVGGFLLVASYGAWRAMHRRWPRWQEIAPVLFASSLLAVPSDFFVDDALRFADVLDPDLENALVVSSTVDALSYPLLLHALVLVAVVMGRAKEPTR